jgi:hypothetical protein
MIQRYPEPQGAEFNEDDREIYDATRRVAARHNVSPEALAELAEIVKEYNAGHQGEMFVGVRRWAV